MAAGLQTTTPADGAGPGEEHRRFDALIAQIEQARAALADWNDAHARYEQAHARSVAPLLRRLHAAHRETVVALDRLADEPGWNREQFATLRDLIVDGARALIDEAAHADADLDADDAALAAILAKHRDADPAASPRPGDPPPPAAEEGDAVDAAVEGFDEEAFMRLHDRRAEARRARDHARRSRRQAAAATQRDSDAALARGSMRDVFRRLASALHPDRETDPSRRDAKTALMQQANRAYAADDLLGLLELQLQTDRLAAGRIKGAGAQRLEHYNRLLGEQHAGLAAELGRKEAAFRAEVGLAPGHGLRPGKLVGFARQDAQALREALAAHEVQMRMLLGDRAAVRQWLKQLRRQRRDAAGEDADGPFAAG